MDETVKTKQEINKDVVELAETINEWFKERGYVDISVVDSIVLFYGDDIDEINLRLKKE